MRIKAARRGWLCVCSLGLATCGLGIFLLAAQPSWSMLAVSLFWALPGAFAARWGAGGARSWIAVTPEQLVVENALRTHTYPWSQIHSIQVSPASPDGRAITQAAVTLDSGRRVPISCPALPFGWAWQGQKRWQTVNEFIRSLEAERERIRASAGPD